MKLKRFIAIFMVLCLIFALTSCSKSDGMNVLFKYALSSDPKNLDPQLATDSSSLMIIENLYEGLIKKSKDGKLENGVAESYSVSENGLKIKFNLKKNYYWKGTNDTRFNLTAKDFVFAFRRLVDPKTYSPYAKKYYAIKNAEKVNKGQLSVDNLSVVAEDDYTLAIELEHPNAEFFSLLAESSSMPCNEEFFYKTEGKYGLETDSIIANGPFFLFKWVYDPYGKDNYLILRKSTYYNSISNVYPSGLNFFVVKDENNRLEGFKKGKYDFFVDDGSNKSLYNKDNIVEKYTYKSSGLVFNLNNPIMKNQGVRKALALAINRKILKREFKNGIESASGLIPHSVTILNKSFRELSSEPADSLYNESLAQYMWTSSLTKAEKNLLNSSTIIVPKGCTNIEYLDIYIKQWEDTLDFFCSVEVLDDNEYINRIKSGNYYMAYCEFSGKTNSPEDFLSTFMTGNENNIYSFSDNNYDSILNLRNTKNNLSECVDIYSKAERYLIENYYYVPMFYNSQYLIYNKKIKGPLYDPFTQQLHFSKLKKF